MTSLFIRKHIWLLSSVCMFSLTVTGCGDDDHGPNDGHNHTHGGTGGSGGTSGSGGTGGSGGTDAGDLDAGMDASLDASDVRQVTLRFAANVGTQAFDCAHGPYAGLGTQNSDMVINDFRFYVHDVRLLTADGEVPVVLDQDDLWQHQSVALLDFEDGDAFNANYTGTCNGTPITNHVIRGTVPAGDYTGLAFRLGVPFELNHSDADNSPSPLNIGALSWSWLTGRKFARIDARAVINEDNDAGVPTQPMPFNFHIGSTACVDEDTTDNVPVTRCDAPNRPEYRFENFNLETGRVIADYAAVTETTDLTVLQSPPPGCMSGATDPDCDGIFNKLGIDLSTGAYTPETQTFFRVE